MNLTVLSLGLIEMIVIGLFSLALVIGCAVDRRRDAENAKWWTLLIIVLLAVVHYWKDFTVSGVLAVVNSDVFWKPALMYLAAGLVYSIPEFYMHVRRSAKFYRESWLAFIARCEERPVFDAEGNTMPIANAPRYNSNVKTESISNGEVFTRAIANTPGEYSRIAKDLLRSYISNFSFRNRIVRLVGNDATFAVEPTINRIELSEHVGAWTLFWPFYLVSLVLGDLLSEVWRAVANFLVTISSKFVRAVFSDVFKI